MARYLGVEQSFKPIITTVFHSEKNHKLGKSGEIVYTKSSYKMQ